MVAVRQPLNSAHTSTIINAIGSKSNIIIQYYCVYNKPAINKIVLNSPTNQSTVQYVVVQFQFTERTCSDADAHRHSRRLLLVYCLLDVDRNRLPLVPLLLGALASTASRQHSAMAFIIKHQGNCNQRSHTRCAHEQDDLHANNNPVRMHTIELCLHTASVAPIPMQCSSSDPTQHQQMHSTMQHQTSAPNS
jgi:hypothetical protein